jgi:hypothetical protein
MLNNQRVHYTAFSFAPLIGLLGRALRLGGGVGQSEYERNFAVLAHGLDAISGEGSSLSRHTYQCCGANMIDSSKQGRILRALLYVVSIGFLQCLKLVCSRGTYETFRINQPYFLSNIHTEYKYKQS